MKYLVSCYLVNTLPAMGNWRKKENRSMKRGAQIVQWWSRNRCHIGSTGSIPQPLGRHHTMAIVVGWLFRWSSWISIGCHSNAMMGWWITFIGVDEDVSNFNPSSLKNNNRIAVGPAPGNLVLPSFMGWPGQVWVPSAGCWVWVVGVLNGRLHTESSTASCLVCPHLNGEVVPRSKMPRCWAESFGECCFAGVQF